MSASQALLAEPILRLVELLLLGGQHTGHGSGLLAELHVAV